MKKPFKPLMLASFALLLCFATAVKGEPYRDGLSIPAPRVFRGMLAFAKGGDYEKIERSLQILTPLSDELFQKYGVDHQSEIRSAISSRDTERLLKSIRRLIFYDMKDLFDHADQAVRVSNEKAKVKIRTAFLDYLVLTPFVEAKNFPSDGKIKKMFRDIQFTLDRSAPFGTEGPPPPSAEAVSEMSGDILKELSSVFPEFTLKELSSLFQGLNLEELSLIFQEFELKERLFLFSEPTLKKLLSLFGKLRL